MWDQSWRLLYKKLLFRSNISKLTDVEDQAKPRSDLVHNSFWYFKSFIKQNSKLRIHSKLDRNQSKLTVCSFLMSCKIVKIAIRWRKARSWENLIIQQEMQQNSRQFFNWVYSIGNRTLCNLVTDILLKFTVWNSRIFVTPNNLKFLKGFLKFGFDDTMFRFNMFI